MLMDNYCVIVSHLSTEASNDFKFKSASILPCCPLPVSYRGRRRLQLSLEQAAVSVSDPFPFNVSFSWDDPNKRGEGRPAICGLSGIFSAVWTENAWGGEDESCCAVQGVCAWLLQLPVTVGLWGNVRLLWWQRRNRVNCAQPWFQGCYDPKGEFT